MIIILDTNIITLLVTSPNDSEEAKNCQEWLLKLLIRGVFFNIPEVCDYEVRRGLLYLEEKQQRSQQYKLDKLNDLRNLVEYLTFSEEVSRIAAAFWARSILMGKTQPKGLSADILILAHAKSRQEKFPGR